jgi:hypothetical protein
MVLDLLDKECIRAIRNAARFSMPADRKGIGEAHRTFNMGKTRSSYLQIQANTDAN